jgi:hypothetical protein
LTNESFEILLAGIEHMHVSTLHIDDNCPPSGEILDGSQWARLLVAPLPLPAVDGTNVATAGEEEASTADAAAAAATVTTTAATTPTATAAVPTATATSLLAAVEVDETAAEVAEEPARVVGPPRSLRSLSLRGNRISSDGASLIGQALSTNTTLKALTLYRNRIADRGAAAIFEALRLNRTLRSLNVGSNRLTDAAVAGALAEALSELRLTHAEVVVRRRMLLGKDGESSGDAQAAAAVAGSAVDPDGGGRHVNECDRHLSLAWAMVPSLSWTRALFPAW